MSLVCRFTTTSSMETAAMEFTSIHRPRSRPAGSRLYQQHRRQHERRLENDSLVNVNADFNWWGSASGPTNAANPSGTGDAIIDPHSNVTFSPWLTDASIASRLCRASSTTRPAPREHQRLAFWSRRSELRPQPQSVLRYHELGHQLGDGHTDLGVSGTSTTANHVYVEEAGTRSPLSPYRQRRCQFQSVKRVGGRRRSDGRALTPPVATEGAHSRTSSSSISPTLIRTPWPATTPPRSPGRRLDLGRHERPSADGQIVGDAVHGFDVLGSHTYLEEATGLHFSVSVIDHSTYSTASRRATPARAIGPISTTRWATRPRAADYRVSSGTGSCHRRRPREATTPS